jgi:hypothetical protein
MFERDSFALVLVVLFIFGVVFIVSGCSGDTHTTFAQAEHDAAPPDTATGGTGGTVGVRSGSTAGVLNTSTGGKPSTGGTGDTTDAGGTGGTTDAGGTGSTDSTTDAGGTGGTTDAGGTGGTTDASGTGGTEDAANVPCGGECAIVKGACVYVSMAGTGPSYPCVQCSNGDWFGNRCRANMSYACSLDGTLATTDCLSKGCGANGRCNL